MEKITWLKDLQTRLDRDLSQSDFVELSDLIDKPRYTSEDVERVGVLATKISNRLMRLAGLSVMAMKYGFCESCGRSMLKNGHCEICCDELEPGQI